jgi:hypothetical protein
VNNTFSSISGDEIEYLIVSESCQNFIQNLQKRVKVYKDVAQLKRNSRTGTGVLFRKVTVRMKIPNRIWIMPPLLYFLNFSDRWLRNSLWVCVGIVRIVREKITAWAISSYHTIYNCLVTDGVIKEAQNKTHSPQDSTSESPIVIQVSVGMENICGSNLHSPGSNGSFRDTLTFSNTLDPLECTWKLFVKTSQHEEKTLVIWTSTWQ